MANLKSANVMSSEHLQFVYSEHKRQRVLNSEINPRIDSIPSHSNKAALLRANFTKKRDEQKKACMKDDSFKKVMKKLREKEIKLQIRERSVVNDVNVLRKTLDEKVQSHRLSDAERENQYKEEIKQLERRLSRRPLLFEQLIVNKAKKKAEQIHQDILEENKLELNEECNHKNGLRYDSMDESFKVNSTCGTLMEENENFAAIDDNYFDQNYRIVA